MEILTPKWREQRVHTRNVKERKRNSGKRRVNDEKVPYFVEGMMEGTLETLVTRVLAIILHKQSYHRDELSKKTLRGIKRELRKRFQSDLKGKSLSQIELIEKLQVFLLTVFNIQIDCQMLSKYSKDEFVTLAMVFFTRPQRIMFRQIDELSREHSAFQRGYKREVIDFFNTQVGEYLFALPFFHIWTRFIEATDAVGETQSLSHYIEDIYDKLSLKLSLFEDEDDQK